MAIRDTYNVTVLLDIQEECEARTYIVADRETGQAAIIDSVLENVDRDLKKASDMGLTIVFAMETHIHADHITGASLIKDRTGAKIVYGGGAQKDVISGVDIFLQEGQEVRFGSTAIKALATPGHTESCTSYVLPGAVFTGDALFIGGNGRTDFQGGSPETLFDSVRKKLFTLPDGTAVYPGHDYNGMVSSTIGEEKKFNARLNTNMTREQFVEIMNNRKIPRPVKMDIAVPANIHAGRSPDVA